MSGESGAVAEFRGSTCAGLNQVNIQCDQIVSEDLGEYFINLVTLKSQGIRPNTPDSVRNSYMHIQSENDPHR